MIFRFLLTGWLVHCFLTVSYAGAEPMRYVALGDSYTVGAGVEAKDAWPSQLVRRLNEDGIEIELTANLARSGWTAQQAIDRQLPQLEKLKPDFVTVLIGVNDWIREGISSLDFQRRLRTLLDGVQEKLSRPGNLLLVGIPDFSCSPRGSTWGFGKSAVNGLKRLNKIIRAEAKARGLPYVGLFDLSQTLCKEAGMFAEDDLHPSAKQYALWLDSVFPAAKNLLEKK